MGTTHENLDDHAINLLLELHKLESVLKIKILRSEARLIAIIKADPGHAVKYYINKSGIPYSSFGKALSKIIDKGIVKEQKCPLDGRSKILT